MIKYLASNLRRVFVLLFYLSLIENHENDDDFERIYHKYRSLVYKVAKNHIKNHHLAEEAEVIVFTGVAKNIDKIMKFDENYLEIYLCKAAKNCAFSVLRKEYNPLTKTVNYESEFKNAEVTDDDILEKIYKNELLVKVVNYVRTMKKEYADIITYHCLHEFTLHECSIILNIPLSTAKTRLYKAQALINEKFKEFRK